MAPLRSFDAFAKPIDGIRERSVTGGVITLLASATAALLFLSQIIVYLQVDVRHSMRECIVRIIIIVLHMNHSRRCSYF